jgi:hypothetical protein
MRQVSIDEVRQHDKRQRLFLAHQLFQPPHRQQLGRVVPILCAHGLDQLPHVGQDLGPGAFDHADEFGERGEDLETVGVLIQMEDHANFDGLVAPPLDLEPILTG